MSKLTTHFKSYSQAINFIVSQMEECEKLFREAVTAGRVDLAEKITEQHRQWTLLLADNLESLNKPVVKKMFESGFVPLDENTLHELHAIHLNNKID